MTRKLLKIALVVLLSVVSISIDAQEKPVLWYDKPARYWEEALPLGNGRLGAMVYGNPVTEEIQLMRKQYRQVLLIKIIILRLKERWRPSVS